MKIIPTQTTSSVPKLPSDAPSVRLSTRENASVETSQPVMLIGNRRDCDLVISNSDASQLHCAVINTGDAILAADLGTRSGTFIDGQRISVGRLYDGCDLRVASEIIEVRMQNPPNANGAASCNSLNSPMLRMSSPDQQIVVPQLPAVIGRRHTCQIVVDTPDVSLAHALLLVINGRPAIYDLGSRSGSYVNGERVALAWISNDDSLRIGGVNFRVTAEDRVLEAGLPAELSADLLSMTRMASAEIHDAEIVAARKREAALTARENQLLEMERALIRRETELAKREAAAAETSAHLKQFMEALSEAHNVIGFGDPNDGQDGHSYSAGEFLKLASEFGQRPDATDDSLRRTGLPAPPVLGTLFPKIGG